MLLVLLVCVFASFLAIALKLNEGDVFSPSVLVCAGFLFCSLWALAFARAWNFTLSPETFLVLTVGVACFVVAAQAVHARGVRRRCPGYLGEVHPSTQSFFELPIRPAALVVFLVVQLAVLIWSAMSVAEMYPAENVFASISAFDQAQKFSDDAESFRFPLSALRNICLAGTYVIVAVIAQELVNKRYTNAVLPGACLLVGIIIDLTSGGRMGPIRILFVLVLFYCVIRRLKNPTEKALSRYMLFGFGFAAVILILFFQASLALVGRSGSGFSLEYLGVYFGAEIPNLDFFIANTGQQDHGIFGYMTFVNLYNYLGDKLGISDFIYAYDQPILFINNHWTGNVYTVFYSFIYDFGFVGVPILTVVMAAVSQWVYESIGAKRASRFWYLRLIVYGFMAFALLLAFYCDRYYEDIFTIDFARTLFYVVLAKWALCDFPRLPKWKELSGSLSSPVRGFGFAQHSDGVRPWGESATLGGFFSDPQSLRMLRGGLVATIIVALGFGAYGWFSYPQASDTVTTSEVMLFVTAKSKEGDTPSTKTQASRTVANQAGWYFYSDDFSSDMKELLGDNVVDEYELSLLHTYNTQTLYVSATGPDGEKANEVLDEVVAAIESHIKESCDLDCFTEISRTQRQATRSGPPKTTITTYALLYAFAGVVAGFTLFFVYYLYPRRLRTATQTKAVARVPLIGSLPPT